MFEQLLGIWLKQEVARLLPSDDVFGDKQPLPSGKRTKKTLT